MASEPPKVLEFNPGDLLVLTTDGFFERAIEKDEQCLPTMRGAACQVAFARVAVNLHQIPDSQMHPKRSTISFPSIQIFGPRGNMKNPWYLRAWLWFADAVGRRVAAYYEWKLNAESKRKNAPGWVRPID